jgi:putative oxidoreductase
MDKICSISVLVSRVLLGLILVVFGLNFFFHYLPLPPLNEPAMAYMMALVNSGYTMNIVKVVEVLAGAMILSGFWLPFGVVFVTPIVVNIVLFHTFLDTGGAPIAYFMLLTWAVLVWGYRNHFKSLFAKKATPTYL